MKLLLTFTGAIAALIGSKSAFAEYTLNMTKGITDISQDIYWLHICLLYTSPSPRDRTRSRMPSSA